MADESHLGKVETIADYGDDDPGAMCRRWIAEINAAEKSFDVYWQACTSIEKRYRDERDDQMTRQQNARKINMLWSNTQTMAPLLYSQTPTPDVGRRHKDPDRVGRIASEVLERAISYDIDVIEFDEQMKACRLDYILAGRGTTWVRYVPVYGEQEEDPYGGEPFRPVVDERVEVEHVHFKSFLHQIVPSWGKVGWVARKLMLTRAQLRKSFGKVANEIELDQRVENYNDDQMGAHGDVFKRACVYEIWDKETRRVIWISKTYNKKPLKVRKDPLRLRNFFPCPKPCYGTFTTDSLIPVPDYLEWKSQALEMDTLTERISLLAEALKVVGVYDGAVPELEQLLTGTNENKLIAVQDWIRFAEQGGMDGAVSFFPIEDTAQVLMQLIEARAQVKEDLYEVSGLADILRGASDPRETARAQSLKSKWAGLRLDDRQKEFARFVKETLAIIGEIIAEHFDPETIMEMTSYPYTIDSDPMEFAQALRLLRNDRLRTFRIDIETDSTIQPNREEEQAKRVEFLAAVTPFLEKVVPAAKEAPELAPLMAEMLMFAIRGFDTARTLESTFEDAIEAFKQAGPKGPTPEEQEKQGKLQIEQQKVEVDAQHKAATIQVDMAKLEIDKAKLDIEREKLMLEREKIQIEANATLDATGSISAADQAKLAEIDLKREALENDRRKLDLEEEKNQIARIEANNKYALEDDKLLDAQEARAEERQDRELDRAPIERVDKAAETLADLGQTLGELVTTMRDAVTEQKDAMADSAKTLGEAAEKMADAQTADKTITKTSDGKWKLEVIAGGK